MTRKDRTGICMEKKIVKNVRPRYQYLVFGGKQDVKVMRVEITIL